MDRYLIESPHDPEECTLLVGYVRAQGYLQNFEWGCHFGVHEGWAIVEAENAEQASLAVPSVLRSKARVIRVEKYAEGPDPHITRGNA
ncbi:MAG: hypothetical protein ABSF61_02615 [Anaerolineales bacterium]|jgi:hypothetical protein